MSDGVEKAMAIARLEHDLLGLLPSVLGVSEVTVRRRLAINGLLKVKIPD